MKNAISHSARRSVAAFSLVEILVASGILGVVATAAMAAIGSGFNIIRATRLDQRATQVLLEKVEVIRLFNWDQLNTPGTVPTSFSEPFFSIGSQTNVSTQYQGQVSISDPALGNGYSSDMRMITIDLTYTNGNRAITRSITTYVSRYGMQQYIF